MPGRTSLSKTPRTTATTSKASNRVIGATTTSVHLRGMRYRKTALLFLAPFLTVFVAFYLAPVAYAIYLSLFIKKRVGIGPAKEVFGGMANYVRAVQDGDFLNGLKNMFVFGVVQVPVMLGLAIVLALLLAE